PEEAGPHPDPFPTVRGDPEVRIVQELRDDALRLKLAANEAKSCKKRRCREHQVERRPDSERAPHVKQFEVDASVLCRLEAQERRDEVATQEEKNCDPEASRDVRNTQMPQKDEKERDSAQTVQGRHVEVCATERRGRWFAHPATIAVPLCLPVRSKL